MTTFADVAAKHGLSLISTPVGGTCRCPFRREKTPSFFADDATGRFHCLSCGVEGDADLLDAMLEGVTIVQEPYVEPTRTPEFVALLERVKAELEGLS